MRPALLIWQASTLAGYVYSIRRITEDLPNWLLPALAYPAVFVNLTHGHNGFLTAMLFGLALLSLNKRPIIAGLLIGCLAYKPHFGLLIPLALLAGGYYRTFASAAVTVIALCAASTLAFGMEIWPAFFDSFSASKNIVLGRRHNRLFQDTVTVCCDQPLGRPGQTGLCRANFVGSLHPLDCIFGLSATGGQL